MHSFVFSESISPEPAFEFESCCIGGACCPNRRGEWWVRLSINTEHLGRTELSLEVSDARDSSARSSPRGSPPPVPLQSAKLPYLQPETHILMLHHWDRVTSSVSLDEGRVPNFSP